MAAHLGTNVLVLAILALLVNCARGSEHSVTTPSGAGGWKVHPGAEVYVASQTPSEIHVQAMGTNPTGGYVTELLHTPTPGDELRFTLRTMKPEGIASQAIARFAIRLVYKYAPFAKTVTVIDGRGEHVVTVDQARD